MLFLLYILKLIESKNYALLINTSICYKNYRHSGNIYMLNELLENRGFNENQITIIQGEDIISNERNVKKNFLFAKQNNETNYFKSKNVCIDDSFILNILDLKSDKLKSLDERDNLFIYLCGHGRDNYMRICNIFFLFKDDIMKKIKNLSKRLNKVFFIIDTCQAEGLIDRNEIPENVFVLTTSRENEKSYSVLSNDLLGVPPCDSFIFLWKQKKECLEMSLIDFFKEFSSKELKSELTYCNKKNFNLKDFFENETEEKEIMPFVI